MVTKEMELKMIDKKEGLEEGLKNAIMILKDFDLSKEDILKKIKKSLMFQQKI